MEIKEAIWIILFNAEVIARAAISVITLYLFSKTTEEVHINEILTVLGFVMLLWTTRPAIEGLINGNKH